LNRRSKNRGRQRLFRRGPARWGLAEWAAIATILAVPLGIISIYQNANNSTSESTATSGSPSSSRAAVTSTTRVAFGGQKALTLAAKYNKVSEGIMWAVPRQLTAEDGRMVEAPGLVGNLPAQQRLEALLAKRGGVRLAVDDTEGSREHSEVRLIVTGAHPTPVLITDMRANIVKREQPIAETMVYGPPQAGGVNIQMGFDLDSLNPIGRSFDKEQNLAGPYFAAKHVSVKAGEQIVFQISAYTTKCYCEWEILVDAVVDGKDQTFTVKDGSRPFRTTAFAESYRTLYQFDFAKNLFIRQPPGSKLSG